MSTYTVYIERNFVKEEVRSYRDLAEVLDCAEKFTPIKLRPALILETLKDLVKTCKVVTVYEDKDAKYKVTIEVQE